MILGNPSYRRDSFFRICLLIFLCPASILLHAQGLSGVVKDGSSRQPVENATVTIVSGDVEIATVTTDALGKYNYPSAEARRIFVVISALSFEPFLSEEVVLDGYSSFLLEHILLPAPFMLDSVVVRSIPDVHIPFQYRITKNDLNTVAGNYDDPIRVAHSKPGIILINDQANHISVRGQQPAYNSWYLEGLEIVNPGHTNNAGTLFDRPAASGGGINMFSAQALGSTEIHTGVNPLYLSRSMGATVNMHLHRSATPEFRAKAGLLGFEFGGGIRPGANSALDINLRYSFTGLLANLGVDFGGEKIGFYDGVVSFRNEGKRHEFKFYAWAGRSENDFDHVPDNEPKERFKDFFDIYYDNTITGSGVSYVYSLGGKSNFRTGISYSQLSTSYKKNGYFSPISDSISIDDYYRLLSSHVGIQTRHSSALTTEMGVQYVKRDLDNLRTFGPFVEESVMRPYLNITWDPVPSLTIDGGADLHYSLFEKTTRPGYRLSATWNKDQSLFYGGVRHSIGQTVIAQSGEGIHEPMQSDQFEIGWKQLAGDHQFGLTTYYQTIDHMTVYETPSGFLHTADFTEVVPALPITGVRNDGQGRYYGVEGIWSLRKSNGLRLEANQSIYWSKRNIGESEFFGGRYDGRYGTHIVMSKEIIRLKKGKNRIWNFSLRGLLHGGLREPGIDTEASQSQEATIYENISEFPVELSVFKRVDLGISRTIAHSKIRWRYALDIQNVFGFTNEAFHFYDPFLQRLETQNHLGIIPVLSVQASW